MRLLLIVMVSAVPLGGLALAWSAPEPASRDIPALLRLAQGFSDEFEGSALKRHWRTDLRAEASQRATVAKRTLWNNRERQVYTAPDYLGLGIQPIRLEHGVLTITARPLTPGQRAAVMAELATLPERQRNSAMRGIAYSSGLISSRGTVSQRYGYFEMRARWSSGKGLWPAFWLLPETGEWPPELDVMEAHGDKPDVVFQSKHSGLEKAVTKRVKVPGGTGTWHRYGMLWTPRTLVFFVDGRETSRQSAPPDANVRMYILANLAVGGAWPGDPDEATRFPATMDIDWIRTYKLPTDWTESRMDVLQ